MPNVAAETQVIAFDLASIAVSSGSACSSGKVQSSHVLRAMGVDDASARNAIRVSLGWQTTESDAQIFITAWNALREGIGFRQEELGKVGFTAPPPLQKRATG
jgi:cysteine desulfurase